MLVEVEVSQLGKSAEPFVVVGIPAFNEEATIARVVLEAQKYAADVSLEATKKRIMGDVLLKQGEGQEKLGIEAYRANANRPERFNNAANVLASVLAR